MWLPRKGFPVLVLVQLYACTASTSTTLQPTHRPPADRGRSEGSENVAVAATKDSPVARSPSAAPSPASDQVGIDRSETPEQRYLREFGSCEFRDPSAPSPLDRATSADLVVDVRAPRELRSAGGAVLGSMPPALAPLAKLLAQRGSELRACLPRGSRGDNPINAGPSAHLRLAPAEKPGGAPRVELEEALDGPIARCVRGKLESMLRNLTLDSTVILAVVLPDGALPDRQQAQTLDKDAIRRTIGHNIGSIRACYSAALDVWPELKGEVTVRFAISSEDGRVLDSRIFADKTQNHALACCVARSVFHWQFPKQGGKGFTVVTYPFVLSTE